MKTSDFLRIDADVHESLKDEVAEDEKESFGKNGRQSRGNLPKRLNDDKLDVKVEKLKDDKVASMAVLSEVKPPYGRDDEDVRYERNGFGYVRQQGDTCTQRKPSACEVPDREQRKRECNCHL